MERDLPATPFIAEWIWLVQRQYESFTDSESRVPSAFLAIYTVMGAAATLAFLGYAASDIA